MGKYKDDEFNFEIDVKEIYPNYPDAGPSDMANTMKIEEYIDKWGEKYHKDIHPKFSDTNDIWPWNLKYFEKRSEIYSVLFDSDNQLDGEWLMIEPSTSETPVRKARVVAKSVDGKWQVVKEK